MKENFDDILKRKWEEQHFPVDEGHREHMIALLDGKNRRKIIPFWWFGGLGVATLLVGYFLFTSGGSAPSGLDTPVSERRDISGSGVDQSTHGLPGSDAKHEPGAEATSRDIQVVNPVQSSTFSSSSSSSSSTSIPSNTETNKTSKNQVQAAGGNSGSRKVDSAKNAEPITSARLQTESMSRGIGNTPADIYQVDDQAMRSYQIVSKSAAVTIEPATRDYIEVEDILLPDFTGIRYASNDLPVQITPNTGLKSCLFLFGETGAGMIFGSKPDFSSGWKFRAGAGLGYKLSPKVQVSLSAGYLLQVGGFDFQRSSTVDFAGFGTRSSFNTLTPDKLHYVYARVGAQYRIRRHLLGAHGGIQYLYGAQGDLVTQVQDQFVAGTTETSTYTWLVTDGLRNMNWTVDLSYGYQLTPRLTAMAGVDYYFAPNTVDDAALAQDGYYWNGAYAPVHPFITLNYLIYAGR